MPDAAALRTPNVGKDDDIPVLDGIRGSLALWVLLGHSLYYCNVYIPILVAPGVAVYVFMMMSGFLMAYHFRVREAREPWQAPSTWVKFYIRRVFRIAPLYYFLLLVAFAFQQCYMPRLFQQWSHVGPQLTPLFVNQPVPNFDLSSLALHFSFLFGLFPSEAGVNILPDWSITLEMQFYLVFPFLMLFMRWIGALWFSLISLAVVVVAQATIRGFPQPMFLPLVLTTFVAGMMIAEAWLVKERAMLCAALAVFLTSIRHPFMFQAITIAVVVLIFLPRMDAALHLNIFARVAKWTLGGRFGRFMADRSYSVYLLHQLVLVPLYALLTHVQWFGHSPPLLRFAVAAPISVAITYSLASLTLKFIENPGIALGRRLSSRVRSPAVVTGRSSMEKMN